MSAAFHIDPAILPSGVTLDPLPFALTSPDAIAELQARAADPNPFFAPSFLNGSLLLNEGWSASALRCYRADGKLSAFLPIRPATFTESTGLAVLKAYRNPYIMRSEPLLDRDGPVEAATSLIEGLVRHAGTARIFQFPMLDLDGVSYAALKEAAHLLGRDCIIVDHHERAVLKQGDTLEKGRVKDVQRQLRRLQAKGQVTLKLGVAGKAASALFEDFLNVEASGWKGAEGTALACRAETLAFARSALDPAGTTTTCDAIYLDDRPIAAAVNLMSCDRMMTLKCGYDEEFRQYSPGVLLDYLVSDAVLKEGKLLQVDGCSVPGHILEKLWPSRLRIGTVLIDIAPSPSPRLFAFRVAVLSNLIGARDMAKTLIRRWQKN